jgi:hypothetical protein
VYYALRKAFPVFLDHKGHLPNLRGNTALQQHEQIAASIKKSFVGVKQKMMTGSAVGYLERGTKKGNDAPTIPHDARKRNNPFPNAI